MVHAPAVPRAPRPLRALAGVLQLLVLLGAVGVVVAHVTTGLGLQRVLSDSMRPAFAAGDHLVVVDRAPDDLRVGDVPVLSFADGTRRAHRVVAVEHDGAGLRVLTRGDANDADDSWTRIGTGRPVPVTVGHLPPAPGPVAAVLARVQADPLPAALLLGLGGLGLTCWTLRRQYLLVRSCTCSTCLDHHAARLSRRYPRPTPRPDQTAPQEIR